MELEQHFPDVAHDVVMALLAKLGDFAARHGLSAEGWDLPKGWAMESVGHEDVSVKTARALQRGSDFAVSGRRAV